MATNYNYGLTCTVFHTFCRQIKYLADQKNRQKIESRQRIETIKKDGETKLSRMKQEMAIEQARSKQKEDEIENLKA